MVYRIQDLIDTIKERREEEMFGSPVAEFPIIIIDGLGGSFTIDSIYIANGELLIEVTDEKR